MVNYTYEALENLEMAVKSEFIYVLTITTTNNYSEYW